MVLPERIVQQAQRVKRLNLYLSCVSQLRFLFFHWKFFLDAMIPLYGSFHQIMALILEEIAIDNETRVSVRKTSKDLQKAEDLHKSALDLAR